MRLQDEARIDTQTPDPPGTPHDDQRFRVAFEQAAIGLAHIGIDGRWLQANRRLCDIVGYSLAELRQRSVEDLIHPDDRAAAQAQFQRLLADECQSYSLEQRLIRKDGAIVWASANVSLLRTATNEPEFLIWVVDDISTHKQTERELRESEARFRTMADNAPVLLWMSGIDGRCDFFNRPWLTFTGRSMEQELGYGWAENIHPDDIQRCLDTYQSGFQERQPFEMEYRLRRADGVYRWVLDAGVPRFAPDGEFIGYIGSSIDITERKQAEQERAELLAREQSARAEAEASEARYRSLIEVIPQIVWINSAEGAADFYNQRWYDYTGLTWETSQGFGWQQVVHPDDLQPCLDRWREAVRAGGIFEIEYRLRRSSDGTYRWHLARALPLRNQAGEIIKWFGTGTDIDDQKRAQAALRESEERLSTVIRATNDAIWDWNLITNQIQWNEATAFLFGYRDDTIQTSATWWREQVHPDDQERVLAGMHDTIQRGEQFWSDEYRFRRADSSYAYVFDRGYVIYNQAGQPVRMIGAMNDLSKRREVEEALRQSEERFRLAAECASDLIYEWDLLGNHLEWFGNIDERLGYATGEFPRTLDAWRQIIHPDDRDAVAMAMDRHLSTQAPFCVEYRVILKDGTIRRWTDRGTALYNQQGQPSRWIGVITDVTERHVLENALKQKTIEQEVLLNSIPALVYYKDRNSAYIAVNQTFAEAVNLPIDQIPGKTDFDLFPVDQAAHFRRDDRQVIQSGQPKFNIEEQATLAYGRTIWIATSKTPYWNETGEVSGLVGFGIDISARKQAEALANGQKRVLEMIALGSPLPEVLDSLARLIEDQSPDGRCSIMLLDETEQQLRDGAAPSLPQGFHQAIDGLPIGPGAGSCGTAAFLRQTIIVTDTATDPLWADWREFAAEYDLGAAWSTPIMSSASEPLGTFTMYYREPRAPTTLDFHLIEIATHIAGIAIERTRTEAALQQALQRLSFHVENTPLGMIEWDQDFRVLRWSQESEKIFGWRAEEVLGKHPSEWQFVYADDVQPVDSVISQMLKGTERRTVTLNRNYTKDGRVIHCAWYCSALLDRAGNPVSVLALVEDITARKRAEAALRFVAEASALLTSSLDYETTLSTLAQLIVPELADWCSVDIVGDDGSVQPLVVAHADPAKVAWAEEIVRRYSYNPDAPYGLLHVIRTGQPEIMSDVPDALLVSIAQNEEHLHLLRKVGFTSYICVPLIARRRTLGALTFVSTDSGRRYDAGDLALAEHLARRAASAVDNAWLYRQAQEGIIARDEFLSIASHELKTPITALHLQAQTLLRSASKGGVSTASLERWINKLEIIDQQAERLTRLTNDLLDVARIRVGRIDIRLEDMDLAETVRDVVLRFEEQSEAAGCPITLHADRQTLINGDRARVEQVVTNLLSNAIKYGGGKPIEITVEADSTTAWLTIRDYGIGIAPENLERIFVRFERAVSSRNYGGLGLGLYIVRQIVEALGGVISVTSELGAGSTFVVALPLIGTKR
jgi:PAS domain S-box-containing protein